MYFITPSKPGIFLFGIHGNHLFGFGEKNKKLCIYQKSILDSGDWEEFYITDVNVMKTECCENGLHVAASIDESIINIAAKGKQFTRVFSIDIFTCKMLYAIDKKYTSRKFNLCCNFLMPVIRRVNIFMGFFLITPRRFKKNKEICQYDLDISSPLYSISRRYNISFDHNPSSSITFNMNDTVKSVYGRSEQNGRIETLTVIRGNYERIFNIPGNDIDSVWHDMTFYTGSIGETFALTQRKNADNVTLRLYYLKFPDFVTNDTMSFQFIASYTVDVNFPAFESSPFLLSYRDQMVKPDFIVFQTSAGIVTVPLRMLSLSESAYLTLRQIPEPPVKTVEIKLSVFQRIRNLLRRKSKKVEVEEKWMSLNSIKKTMGLSNNFELR